MSMKISFNKDVVIALVGMAILQSNALPYLIKAWQGIMPPTIIPSLMTIAGLSCYMYYAIKRKDPVYILGNGIGIASNVILVALYYTM